MRPDENSDAPGERAAPITISMRPGLVQAIDGARGQQTRSDYVRHAIQRALNVEGT